MFLVESLKTPPCASIAFNSIDKAQILITNKKREQIGLNAEMFSFFSLLYEIATLYRLNLHFV